MKLRPSIIYYPTCPMPHQKLIDLWRHKTMIYNQENKKQTIESESKKNQIVDIADKEFKILRIIWNMLK